MLKLRPGMVVADCTIGDGGDTIEILKAIGPTGRLIGIDMDKQAIQRTERRLQNDSRLSLFCTNFTQLDRVIKEFGINEVDAVLYDLGLSTLQIGTPTARFFI